MAHLPFLQALTATGGDWVIYLLFVFSIIAVTVIIERITVVTRQFKYQEKILPSVTERLEAGADANLIKNLRHDSVLYRVSKELLDHAANGNVSLERHLETRLAVERRGLEKRVIILGTLGNNAPFVGLLGT